MERKLVTVAEFERMSPAEQDAAFKASVVTNLDDVPADFVARVRTRLEAHIAATEASTSS